MRILTYATSIAVLASATAMAAEVPDPNPAPNSDGTNTWYVGNNTQYPIIQDVLDACGDGDEIVVAAGLYVESLAIDNNDVTLRPFCNPAPSPIWDLVTFWNPTEGFENDNEYAMYVTGGNNTYIGRPRMLTQLPNTNVVATMVQPGEWGPVGAPVSVVDVSNNSGGVAMKFWSRSIDNVAIYSDNGQATFQDCFITSSAGFGGGAMITGSGNTTQFVRCFIGNTYAGGQAFGINGEPVCAVTIIDGEPQFHNCMIANCEGGEAGTVYQRGGGGVWYNSNIDSNWNAAGEGAYYCEGGTPAFYDCTFSKNHAREGTMYFDSTGVDGARFMNFVHCNFDGNTTMGGQYGGAVKVACNDCAGDAPEISFSDCGFDLNNGNSGLGLYDIDSRTSLSTASLATSMMAVSCLTHQPTALQATSTPTASSTAMTLMRCSACSTRATTTATPQALEIGDLLDLIAIYGTSCH